MFYFLLFNDEWSALCKLVCCCVRRQEQVWFSQTKLFLQSSVGYKRMLRHLKKDRDKEKENENKIENGEEKIWMNFLVNTIRDVLNVNKINIRVGFLITFFSTLQLTFVWDYEWIGFVSFHVSESVVNVSVVSLICHLIKWNKIK